MEEEKHSCPCCGHDITKYVHRQNVLYIRRKNAEKMRDAQRKDPELRKQLNQSSAKRLKAWREANPEEAKALARRATSCRTEETFARQADTIKETNRRKTLKFAELLFAARQNGRELTSELESELLQKAREIVKKELKEERRAAKKKP